MALQFILKFSDNNRGIKEAVIFLADIQVIYELKNGLGYVVIESQGKIISLENVANYKELKEVWLEFNRPSQV